MQAVMGNKDSTLPSVSDIYYIANVMCTNVCEICSIAYAAINHIIQGLQMKALLSLQLCFLRLSLSVYPA